MAFDANLSILIVDDYKTMLRNIHNLLEQLSFTNVDEVADGARLWPSCARGNTVS